ncbi:MAG: hypothetical protein NC432_08670 [Roseburia sp.]|nr:hypothetical protein [Roseburia sp.]MCM1097814.1 hypothetical protein [Ruminococcus flavefaciens]
MKRWGRGDIFGGIAFLVLLVFLPGAVEGMLEGEQVVEAGGLLLVAVLAAVFSVCILLSLREEGREADREGR